MAISAGQVNLDVPYGIDDLAWIAAGTLVCVIVCIIAAVILSAIGQAFEPRHDRRPRR